jgi:hypothetical protein
MRGYFGISNRLNISSRSRAGFECHFHQQQSPHASGGRESADIRTRSELSAGLRHRSPWRSVEKVAARRKPSGRPRVDALGPGRPAPRCDNGPTFSTVCQVMMEVPSGPLSQIEQLLELTPALFCFNELRCSFFDFRVKPHGLARIRLVEELLVELAFFVVESRDFLFEL